MVGGKRYQFHPALNTPGRGKRAKWIGERERKKQREQRASGGRAEIPRKREKQRFERRGSGVSISQRFLENDFLLFLCFSIYWLLFN